MSYNVGKAEEGQFEESKYIAPGVHDVKITAIEAGEPDGKSPYLKLTFENAKGQTADGKLYFSEAAKPFSETTIKEMKKAVGQNDTEVTGGTLTEFSKKLFKVIGGKTFRHRFTAEEIQGKLDTETGKQKKNWFKAVIGKKYSSESVSTSPSRLKPLDKNNKWDYKMLPVADAGTTTNPSVGGVTIGNDDLPF